MTTGRINQVAALKRRRRNQTDRPPRPNTKAEAKGIRQRAVMNHRTGEPGDAMRRPVLNLSPRGPAVKLISDIPNDPENKHVRERTQTNRAPPDAKHSRRGSRSAS